VAPSLRVFPPVYISRQRAISYSNRTEGLSSRMNRNTHKNNPQTHNAAALG
jgi:hypothetical protein